MLPGRRQVELPCDLASALEQLGSYSGTLTSTLGRMAPWQRKLFNLEGLSHDEKLYVEGKLLALGRGWVCDSLFKDDEPDGDTVRRLRSLLPQAGETRERLTNVIAPQSKPQRPWA